MNNRIRKLAAQVLAETGNRRDNSNDQNDQKVSNGSNDVKQRAEAIRKILAGNSCKALVSFTGDSVSPSGGQWFEKDRRLTMANLKVIMEPSQNVEICALFDTGAFPLSHISERWTKRNGLMNLLHHKKEQHQTAQAGSRFRSLGDIRLPFELPNGFRIAHDFKVANIATEMIIGRDLCKRLGLMIDFTKDIMLCKNANNCKMRMIPVSDWKRVGKISASDFDGSCPH